MLVVSPTAAHVDQACGEERSLWRQIDLRIDTADQNSGVVSMLVGTRSGASTAGLQRNL